MPDLSDLDRARFLLLLVGGAGAPAGLQWPNGDQPARRLEWPGVGLIDWPGLED